MKRRSLDRRDFFRKALAAAVALPAADMLSRWPADPGSPCDRATPFCRFVDEGEPGEPLHVSGKIFAADGVTPAPGVILYAFHADAQGHYGREGEGNPRLRGWMKTGADGRYNFRTIRPAPYPNERVAAHIHTMLWGDGVPAQVGPNLLFEGDPLISETQLKNSAALGRFAPILRLVRDPAGVLQATLDIRLKRTGDRFPAVALHGLRPCGMNPGN